MFERLESRRLFAAAVVDEVLRIDGTPLADDIKTRYNLGGGEIVAITIITNGVEETFDTVSFNGIVVSGGGGNDRINLSTVAGNATILGGNGNDRLVAGLGIEAVGGAGNDRIYATDGGHATLQGGEGNDLLFVPTRILM